MTQEQLLELSPIEDEVLDIIANADDMTTSDLQGAISIQLLKAYNLGKAKGQ